MKYGSKWACLFLDSSINELHSVLLKLRNQQINVAQLLVHHKAQNAHHGRTSVVELNGTLSQLFLVGKVVPAPVNGAVAKVTDKLVAAVGVGLHNEEFQKAHKEDDGDQALLGNTRLGRNGSDTVGVIGKLVAGVINVAGKTNAGTGDELTDNGEHTNTSVLDFDGTETIESGLRSVGDDAEGIEEAQWRLGAEFVLVGGEGCSTGSTSERLAGEGRGRGEDGSDQGGLHGIAIGTTQCACVES